MLKNSLHNDNHKTNDYHNETSILSVSYYDRHDILHFSQAIIPHPRVIYTRRQFVAIQVVPGVALLLHMDRWKSLVLVPYLSV